MSSFPTELVQTANAGRYINQINSASRNLCEKIITSFINCQRLSLIKLWQFRPLWGGGWHLKTKTLWKSIKLNVSRTLLSSPSLCAGNASMSQAYRSPHSRTVFFPSCNNAMPCRVKINCLALISGLVHCCYNNMGRFERSNEEATAVSLQFLV